MTTTPCPVCTPRDKLLSTVYLSVDSNGEYSVTREEFRYPQCLICSNARVMTAAALLSHADRQASLQSMIAVSTMTPKSLAKIIGVSEHVLLRMAQGLGPITDEQLNKLKPFMPMKH